MDGRMDGLMDGLMDGWINEGIDESCRCCQALTLGDISAALFKV